MVSCCSDMSLRIVVGDDVEVVSCKSYVSDQSGLSDMSDDGEG